MQVLPIQVPEDGGKLTRDQLIWQTKWLEGKLQEKFVRRHQNAPWLKESQAYIHEAAPFLCFNATKNINTGVIRYPSRELLAQGRKLVAEGCDDPLFCFLVAWTESFMKTPSAQSVKLLSTRWRSWMGANDPAIIKAMATAWLWYACEKENKATSNQELQADCEAELPGLIASALEETPDKDESVGVYLALYGSRAKLFITSKHLFVKERLEICKGAPWLVDTLLGEGEITDAWAARGNGWGSSVTAEGWKGFEEHLGKAREHLTRAWVANPDAPWAATSMITVTMAGHGVAGVDERVWFDRAIAAVFDHEQAYTNLLYAYGPRWGGSHELMLDFGKACADTKRYDAVIVPSRLFKAVTSVVEDLSCRTSIYKDADLCRRIVELQKGMVEHTEEAEGKHYFRSFLVVNAFLTGDFDTAASAYHDLGGKPLFVDAVNRFYFYGIPPLVWIGTLELHKDREAFTAFQEAEEAYGKFDHERAQKLYEQVLTSSAAQASRSSTQLVRMRLAAIAVEKRIRTGEWVSLNDEESRLLWVPAYNNWWNEANGVLALKNAGEGALARTILNARIGVNFEMSGRLSNPPGLPRSQLGIVFGYRWNYREYATAVGGLTRWNAVENGAALVKWAYDTSSSNPPVPIEIKPDSAFRLRMKNGTATLWIDEKEAFSSSAESLFDMRDPWSEEDSEQNLIGLGCNYFPKGETRFTDLKFRRL